MSLHRGGFADAGACGGGSGPGAWAACQWPGRPDREPRPRLTVTVLTVTAGAAAAASAASAGLPPRLAAVAATVSDKLPCLWYSVTTSSSSLGTGVTSTSTTAGYRGYSVSTVTRSEWHWQVESS